MKSFTSLVLLMIALGCGSALGQTSTMLCSPPQTPDCVMPQWGSIHPDDPDPDGLVAPSTSVASRSTNRPALVRVAMSTASTASVAPKIVVDDGKTFARETRSLIAALKAARFDAEGKLIAGADRIKTALDRLNAVSRNHQLTVYLKTSRKLRATDRTLLAAKVEALNALLEGSAKR
jgi:hypothetical protein